MKDGKLLIAIVNSSSFGISFPEHLRALSAFAELIRVEMPKGAPAAEFHARLAGVDGIVASVTPPYTREVLLGLPELKLLARHGVGCDNVDLPTCNELGIVVSRVGPQVERESVAQMTLGLIHAAARQIVTGCSHGEGGAVEPAGDDPARRRPERRDRGPGRHRGDRQDGVADPGAGLPRQGDRLRPVRRRRRRRGQPRAEGGLRRSPGAERRDLAALPADPRDVADVRGARARDDERRRDPDQHLPRRDLRPGGVDRRTAGPARSAATRPTWSRASRSAPTTCCWRHPT